MQPMIVSKLPGVGTTIFTVMSALAQQHNAINLGQGFPDYPMSEALIELVYTAMQDGHNQYAAMPGNLALRQAIAEKVFKLYGNEINADANITITPGGTYAIYSAITAVVGKGDEVIVFEPAYDSYIPNIELNGGKAIRLKLKFPTYSIDWDEVRQAINHRTKMIIINSPHNPTGAVLNADDMQQLQNIVADTGIFILSDEVYEHLVYDDLRHESILRYPGLLERSFVCFSFGKVYNCTGWKLGYCIAPEAFTKEFRKVHQFNCFSVNSFVQVALATFLQDEFIYLGLSGQLQQKRDYFRSLMKATPFQPIPSHGSYFELYTYAGVSDEKETDLAMRMIKECGVVSIPASAFYTDGDDNKVLRFCFAKREETLKQAAENISRFQF